MKRLKAYLAVTAAALAVAAVQPGAASAGSGEIQVAKVQRLEPQMATLKRVDPSKFRIKLLCSPKYRPSKGAASVSYKGGSYTCTHTVAVPPAGKCRNGFAPSKLTVELLPGGKYVRLVYRCQSSPW